MGMRRLLLGVTSVFVVAGFAAASATAAPPPALPPLFATHGLALPGYAAPGLTTAAPSTTAPQASLFLQTDPVQFKVNGVSYVMSLSAYKAIGHPATVDVFLSRAGGSASGQDYNYTLKPGVGFTANLTTLRAGHLASGASVAPSTIHLSYSATPGSAYPSRCTLANGTKKSFVGFSMGKVSVSSLGIATGSSFFGDVKARPLTASMGYDPGCRSGGGHVQYLCLGPATLQTSSSAPANAWWAIDLHGTSRAIEEAFSTGTTSTGLSVIQDAGAVSHIDNTLPPPTFTETGAKAVFKTTGDPFMRGIATFTSTQPPAISKPHTCTDFKDFSQHTYVLHVYRGILSPGKTSPLRAMFDTGAIPLIAQPAQLDKVVYTN
jgi:hypothetical protein